MNDEETRDNIIDSLKGDPGPMEPPEVIAERLHARLQGDSRLSATELPSLEDLQRAAEELRVTQAANDPTEELLELLGLVETGINTVLGRPAKARPRLVMAPELRKITATKSETMHPTMYVIRAHPSLFGLTDVVAKAISSCLPPDFVSSQYSPEYIREYSVERMETVPELTIFPFSEAAVYLAHTADYRQSAVPWVDRSRAELCQVFKRGADMFVLGHECAHYQCAHGDDGGELLAAIGGDRVPDDDRETQEVQADLIAALIGTHALNAIEFPPPLFALGIRTVFAAWEAKELASCVIAAGDRKSGIEEYRKFASAPAQPGAYPSFERRRLRIAEEFRQHPIGDEIGPLFHACDVVLERMMWYTAGYAETLPTGAE